MDGPEGSLAIKMNRRAISRLMVISEDVMGCKFQLLGSVESIVAVLYFPFQVDSPLSGLLNSIQLLEAAASDDLEVLPELADEIIEEVLLSSNLQPSIPGIVLETITDLMNFENDLKSESDGEKEKTEKELRTQVDKQNQVLL